MSGGNLVPGFLKSFHNDMVDLLVLTPSSNGAGKINVHNGQYFIIAIPVIFVRAKIITCSPHLIPSSAFWIPYRQNPAVTL